MEFNVTEDQRRALHDDGIVKLSGLVDSTLLDELKACFEWSVDHPGPIAVGKTEGENIFFVDNANPEALPMYQKLVAKLPKPSRAVSAISPPLFISAMTRSRLLIAINQFLASLVSQLRSSTI